MKSGDITQFRYAGREFAIVGGEDITMRLSGWNIENTPNGDGSRHATGSRKLAGLDSVPIRIDNTRGDWEFLQEKQDGSEYPLSITLFDGKTYSGQMAIEGELDYSTREGRCNVNFMGSKLEQI
jgi:hypothetical protein